MVKKFVGAQALLELIDILHSEFDKINNLYKATAVVENTDLNNLYIDQSPVNIDCAVRKWIIPSAAVGGTLKNLPTLYKADYPNCEIEWHTLKEGGVGYQVITGGTATNFQRFMRIRITTGWGDWYMLTDSDISQFNYKILTQSEYDAITEKTSDVYFIYEE